MTRLFCATLLLVSWQAVPQPLAVTNTFSNSTVADAEEINQNFADIIDGVNGKLTTDNDDPYKLHYSLPMHPAEGNALGHELPLHLAVVVNGMQIWGPGSGVARMCDACGSVVTRFHPYGIGVHCDKCFSPNAPAVYRPVGARMPRAVARANRGGY